MRSPETVTSDLTLQILVDDYFLHRRYQAFPVTQNGNLIGIISLNQVKATPRENWQKQTVAETMTPMSDTVAVRPDTPMTQVLQQMEDSGMRRVLVTRDDQLQGIITGGDVSKELCKNKLCKFYLKFFANLASR